MTSLNERFLAFLEEGTAPPPSRSWRGPLAVVAGALLLGTAFVVASNVRRLYAAPLFSLGAWMLLRGLYSMVRTVLQKRLAERVRQTVARGQRVNAFIVRAPDGLYRPGSIVRPCQVLISFQPEVSGDRKYMEYLCRRWAGQIRDREGYRRNRRARLPRRLTDGSTVYCCDLYIHPALLASGYLTSSVLPCIAEEGAQGGIELVPYWLLFPYDPAMADAEPVI